MVRGARGSWKLSRSEDPEDDLTSAEKDLDRAVELDRNHADAHLWRGHIRWSRAMFREKGQDVEGARAEWERAAAAYEEAVRLKPSLEPSVRERIESARRASRHR
jgi:tetratricopeptide (TPR) repeat protein